MTSIAVPSNLPITLFDAVVKSELTKEYQDEYAELIKPLSNKWNECEADFASPAEGLGIDSHCVAQIFPIVRSFLNNVPATDQTFRAGGKFLGAHLKGLQLAGADVSDEFITDQIHYRIAMPLIDEWKQDVALLSQIEMADLLEEGAKAGISSPRTDVKRVIESHKSLLEVKRQDRARTALGGAKAGDRSTCEFIWPELLGNSKKPAPRHPANCRAYLHHIGIVFEWNEWSREVSVKGLPGKLNSERVRVDDGLASDLALGMSDLGCDVPLDFFVREIGRIARQNPYHPVKEYLATQQRQWDKAPRLEMLFIDYAGADDTPLNRAIGTAFGITCVKRARHPGSALYGFPILEGYTGGEGKSLFAKTFAGELLDLLPAYATLIQGSWSAHETFEYRYASSPEGLFGFIAKLREGLFVSGFALADATQLPTEDEKWVRPGDLLALLDRPDFDKRA